LVFGKNDSGKIGLSVVAPTDRGGEEVDPGRGAGGAVDHRERKKGNGSGRGQFRFKFK
jgi:hypothetical protein